MGETHSVISIESHCSRTRALFSARIQVDKAGIVEDAGLLNAI
jgi:hypothetical protein